MKPIVRQAQWLDVVVMLACAGLAACGTTTTSAVLDRIDAGQDAAAADAPALDAAVDATAGDAATDSAALDADTGPSDGGTADAPDSKIPSKEQLCEGYANQYKSQLPAVDACDRDSDCGIQAPDSLLCGCGHFTNLGASKWVDLQQSLQDFNSHKCSTGFCGGVVCPDLTTSIGVCITGTCQAKAVKCADLQAAWDSLKADVQKCTGAGDCAASLDVAIGCGACKVPASITLLAVGSPQSLYAALLEKQWNDQNCAPDPPLPCACAPLTQADCVAGVCQAK